MLEAATDKLKCGHKQIVLSSGEILEYEKLLIATGTKLKLLDIDGSNLKNIFYLKSQKQSDTISEYAGKAERGGVVVGCGHIGAEAAAVLNQN